MKKVKSKSELNRKNLTDRIQKIIKNDLENELNLHNEDQVKGINEI